MYRLGILVDHQLCHKTLPLKIPRSGSACAPPSADLSFFAHSIPASKVLDKKPELVMVWPERAPRKGPFPGDTGMIRVRRREPGLMSASAGRRLTIVASKVHISPMLRCQLGAHVAAPPELEFFSSEVFYAELPEADTAGPSRVALSNDSEHWSAVATVDLYDSTAVCYGNVAHF